MSRRASSVSMDVCSRRQILWGEAVQVGDRLGKRSMRRRGVPLAQKSLGRQPRDVVLCRAGEGQLRQDLADHRGKLESAPRAPAGDDDLLMTRVSADDHVAIARYRPETGFGADKRALQSRYVHADGRV